MFPTRLAGSSRLRFAIAFLAFASAASAQVNFYSFEKEAALGRELAQELQGSSSPQVDTIVQQLVAASPELPFSITAKVFDRDKLSIKLAFPVSTDSLEPVVLPGGFIFIPSRMLSELSTQQLTAALAHAIAHVRFRHSTRYATREQLLESAGAKPGVVLTNGMLRLAETFEAAADAEAIRLAGRAAFESWAATRKI